MCIEQETTSAVQCMYSWWYVQVCRTTNHRTELGVCGLDTYLPYAHAQKGKVIGNRSVIVVIVVVVSTKIARSRILGEVTSATCSQSVRNRKKSTYVRQGCPKGTTKAINRAFCWSRLLVTPTVIICIIMHGERSRKRTSTLAIDQYS